MAYTTRHASATSDWLCNFCPLALTDHRRSEPPRHTAALDVLEENSESRIGSEDTQDLHRDIHKKFVEVENKLQRRIF